MFAISYTLHPKRYIDMYYAIYTWKSDRFNFNQMQNYM